MRPEAYVYCHRPSEGANTLVIGLLQGGLIAKRIYGIRAPRRVRPVVNWGCSSVRGTDRMGRVLNHPSHVLVAQSKVATADLLKHNNIPSVQVTGDANEANAWVADEAKVLVRRDGLSGGRGIRPYFPGENQVLGRYEFYARVFPKTHEFRVHVCNGLAIDLVQKKASSDRPADRLIRTHRNGWVFAHDGLVLQDQKDIDLINDLAISAVEALGLDFGAVDILATVHPPKASEVFRKLKKAVVCEVNTAPGLENTRTIRAYSNHLKNLLQEDSYDSSF